MPRKVLEKFSVEFLQILDEKGKVDKKLMPKLSQTDIKNLYNYMILTRVFDEKAFKLQRQGRLGTYAQSLGQEAASVGSAYALTKEDSIFPSFREHGAFIVKGYPLAQYFQFWSGDERGSQAPANINIMPVSIPVATHIPHAAGFGWAMKMQKNKAIAVAYFGDGATSKGDFHEALNFAAVFKAQTLFICQNNQWAISVPFSKQTASLTVAQKAIGYGIRGIRVDGNDVFAVYRATKEAADNARKGGGPTLIECLTYRRGDHTTSDDAKRYRLANDVKLWERKDPISRLEKYMTAKKMITSTMKDKIWKDAEEKVEAAVKEFESIEKPNPEDMFNYVYEEMPAELKKEYDDFKGAQK